MIRKIGTRALCTLAAVTLSLPWLLLITLAPASAADSTVAWPLNVRTQKWNIVQGYNNGSLGGSHDHGGSNPSQLYGFDLIRADGPTAGQTVTSPVAGKVESTTVSVNFGYGLCEFIDL